jgi:hypothetical protein
MYVSEFTVNVQAGKYVLGDPCYTVRDEDWSLLLSSCDYFTHPVGKVSNIEVLAFSTKWGDGEYKDNKGNTYGVDAGLIGLVPLEYAEPTEGSVIVDFKRLTKCSRTEEGLLIFGDYVINTNPDEYEDEYAD